jgi:calcineurin-like phosphoesterase family protein
MTTWFSSDTHLKHGNIPVYCPERGERWDTLDEMDEGLVDLWNGNVKPDDDVWFLGDFAMGKITESLPMAARLNGHKKLVPGNHDRCWSHLKKYEKWEAEYAKYFEIMPPIVELDVGRAFKFLLCHFPYQGDSGLEDRYTEARPVKAEHQACDVLLHGHVHDTWKIRDDLVTHGNHGLQINVGVDVWDFAPVSLEEIIELL